MRRVFASVVVFALSASYAGAADFAVSPTHVQGNWNGAYVGFGTGFGAGNLEGAFGALLFGANFQVNRRFIIGLDGDVSFGNLNGSLSCASDVCNFQDRWLGTARTRIGYSLGNVLLYGSGGLAVGNLSTSGIVGGSVDTTRVGYAVGAGIEVSVSRNWSLRADYLHIDLGNASCLGLCNSASFRATTELARIGLVYRFFQEAVEEFNVFGPPIMPPPFRPSR